MKHYLTDFPTTQFRIVVSALVFLAIAVSVIAFKRDLADPFYWFVLAWGGVDVAQYTSKRLTYKANEPQSQDLSQGA